MAGGGGGGVQTIENIPDWLKPSIQYAANTAADAHQQGELGQVAGFNQDQRAGLDQLRASATAANQQYGQGLAGQDVLRDQALGRGTFAQAQTDALKRGAIDEARGALGQVNSLAGGSQVGGARSELLKGGIENDLANQFAQFDYDALRNQQQLQSQGAQSLLGSSAQLTQQAGAGADYLGQAGQAQQQQDQAELDSTYTGLAQLSSLLSGANPGVSHIQKGGK